MIISGYVLLSTRTEHSLAQISAAAGHWLAPYDAGTPYSGDVVSVSQQDDVQVAVHVRLRVRWVSNSTGMDFRGVFGEWRIRGAVASR